MTINIDKMRAEMKVDSHRFMLQALATGAGCVAAGAALATLVLHLTGHV